MWGANRIGRSYGNGTDVVEFGCVLSHLGTRRFEWGRLCVVEWDLLAYTQVVTLAAAALGLKHRESLLCNVASRMRPGHFSPWHPASLQL
jgi:hypothetical protein